MTAHQTTMNSKFQIGLALKDPCLNNLKRSPH